MRNFSLELNQLKVFMEVAKDCNMTRAAQKLGLTQPAISTVIKKIENGLGIELFDRASRPMRLLQPDTFFLNEVMALLNSSKPSLRICTGQPMEKIPISGSVALRPL